MERPPSPRGPAVVGGSRLDRAADRAQDLADLAAQEDEGNDRDDRDEGEDQRVLREALAIFAAELLDRAKVEIGEQCHGFLSWMSTHPQMRAAPLYEGHASPSP